MQRNAIRQLLLIIPHITGMKQTLNSQLHPPSPSLPLLITNYICTVKTTYTQEYIIMYS